MRPRRRGTVAGLAAGALVIAVAAGAAGFAVGRSGAGGPVAADRPGGSAPDAVADGAPTTPAPALPPAPSGSDGAGAVTLVVDEVVVDGDLIRLLATVTNAHDGERILADEDHGPVLVDARGGTYPSRAQLLTVEALSTTAMTLEFAGPVQAEVGALRLRFFADGGVYGDRVAIDVPAIPVPDGEVQRFAGPRRVAVAFADLVVHHPSALTVTAYTLQTGGAYIDVSLLAVNGRSDEVALGHDRPYLQDPRGRRFWAVPPADNPDLEIPGRQRLTGTLRFLGPLPADVEELTLWFNADSGQDGETAYGRPRVRLDGLDLRGADA